MGGEMKPDVINVTQQESQAADEGYLHRVLVALDIFLNVVFKGREDETISARSYRAALEGKIWGPDNERVLGHLPEQSWRESGGGRSGTS